MMMYTHYLKSKTKSTKMVEPDFTESFVSEIITKTSILQNETESSILSAFDKCSLFSNQRDNK